jgi:hypothetical protein
LFLLFFCFVLLTYIYFSPFSLPVVLPPYITFILFLFPFHPVSSTVTTAYTINFLPLEHSLSTLVLQLSHVTLLRRSKLLTQMTCGPRPNMSQIFVLEHVLFYTPFGASFLLSCLSFISLRFPLEHAILITGRLRMKS